MATTKVVSKKPAFPNAAFTPVAPSGARLGSINTLSLANGMTAGYGVEDGTYQNPPAMPGTYGGNPIWAPKRIGVIRNVPGSVPNAGPKKQFSLYFIFNPNQINVQFATNQSQIPANYIYGNGGLGGYSGSSSVPNITNAQAVSWSLIFDRTYDFIHDAHPDEDRGVLKDVAALYNIMGTFSTDGATPLATPVQVVFAQTGSGQLWGFTGFISSIDITYGIFRANMIPSRAEVDITLTATYVSSQAPTSGSANTGTKTPTNKQVIKSSSLLANNAAKLSAIAAAAKKNNSGLPPWVSPTSALGQRLLSQGHV